MSPAVKAEAASWLARLRADDRTPADEAAFQRWLAASPDHAGAFATVNAVWEATGAVKAERWMAAGRSERLARRVVLAGFGGAILIGAGFSAWHVAEAGVYETEVGEQKHVGLEDGTQMFLDTDTRLRVAFDSHFRTVYFERGQANFHIAVDAKRPFVVDAADQHIIAADLVSTLDVRCEGAKVSVVMIQGEARVAAVRSGAGVKPRAVSAGERLIVSAPNAANVELVKIDRPNLTPLIAWQSGQAVFENETLGRAVAEMNRYSPIKLKIADPALAALRISGVYRVGDNTAFANSIETLFPVAVVPGTPDLELKFDRSRQS